MLFTDGTRRFEALRWGLIPSWAKDLKIGYKLINARAETIFEKPSFRSAIKQRMCLVLADGFYEWHRTQDAKTPMFIRLRSKRPFGFAGLWESWSSPDGQDVRTCAIVTTEPNELMKPIHNRMPVIVPKELEDLWMAPGAKEQEELARIPTAPYPAEAMEAFEVSKRG